MPGMRVDRDRVPPRTPETSFFANSTVPLLLLRLLVPVPVCA